MRHSEFRSHGGDNPTFHYTDHVKQMSLFCAAAAFLRCSLFHGTLRNEAVAISISMFCIVQVSAVVGAALPLLLAQLQLDPGHAGAAIQVSF